MNPKVTRKVSGLLRGMLGTGGARLVRKAPAPTPAVGVFDRLRSPAAEGFTIGFGRAKVLPDDIGRKKYYVAGYGSNNPAKGVLDPPYAHAVWIDDNSGRGAAVFVSIDDVGMLNADVNAVKGALAGFLAGKNCRSVNILSTHNHAGIDTMGIWGPLPLSGKSPKYMKVVSDGVCEAVALAYEDRRDGSLYHGTTEVPDMQEDIRLPTVYSKTLTRFRFVPDDGSREIYILNFASHSESLGGGNSHVSADFPGHMREEIRQKTGAETIYFVGAIGGMISMTLPGGKASPETTKKIGRRLAGCAMSIENETRLEPELNILRQELVLSADNTVLLLAARLGILNVKAYGTSDSPLGYALLSEMTYLELGSVKCLLLPCEIFPELVFGGYLSAEESAEGVPPDINPAPLARIAEDDGLLIFGLANDEIGYVLPPNDFLLNPDAPYLENGRDRLGRKHYEETNSVGPRTAGIIAETFEKMMTAVRAAREETV